MVYLSKNNEFSLPLITTIPYFREHEHLQTNIADGREGSWWGDGGGGGEDNKTHSVKKAKAQTTLMLHRHLPASTDEGAHCESKWRQV